MTIILKIQKDTVYRERANNRWEYHTYCDGKQVFVSESWINKHRHSIRIIKVV